MVYWETAHTILAQPQFVLDWTRQWQAAEKIVYLETLAEPRSARTRVEREVGPDAVRRLKADAKQGISIHSPELAAQAIRAGLVGECFFPDGVRLDLELLEERPFGNGVVVLRYGVRGLLAG